MMTSYNRLDRLPTDCLLLILSYAEDFLVNNFKRDLLISEDFQIAFKERFFLTEDYENAYNQDFKKLFLHKTLFNNFNLSSFTIEESDYDEDTFYAYHTTKRVIKDYDPNSGKIRVKRLSPPSKYETRKITYEYKSYSNLEDEAECHYEDSPSSIPVDYILTNLYPNTRRNKLTRDDIFELKDNEQDGVIKYICDITEAVDEFIRKEGFTEALDYNIVEEIDEEIANDKLGDYEKYYLIAQG